jgi:hypothetical protein
MKRVIFSRVESFQNFFQLHIRDRRGQRALEIVDLKSFRLVADNRCLMTIAHKASFVNENSRV